MMAAMGGYRAHTPGAQPQQHKQPGIAGASPRAYGYNAKA